MTGDRVADTATFYRLLADLSDRLGGTRTLQDATPADFPALGVYFFFEPDQLRTDGAPRAVRIGTHALTRTSRTTLWGRLAQHRGTTGGAHPGGGNHRGSIFRHHVGTALLAHGDWDPRLAATWMRRTTDAATREAEYPLERAVSMYIGAMPLLWLPVPDRDGRGLIERHSIALLSLRTGGVDAPSSRWLGLHAAGDKVRSSGLWNVNHVDDDYDPAFLIELAALIRAVPPSRQPDAARPAADRHDRAPPPGAGGPTGGGRRP